MGSHKESDCGVGKCFYHESLRIFHWILYIFIMRYSERCPSNFESVPVLCVLLYVDLSRTIESSNLGGQEMRTIHFVQVKSNLDFMVSVHSSKAGNEYRLVILGAGSATDNVQNSGEDTLCVRNNIYLSSLLGSLK